MIDKGTTEILISKTATEHLLKSSICSCSYKDGKDCDNPYINAHDAMESFDVPRREQEHKLVSLRRGGMIVFADRLCHAGFAASPHCNRRIFAAPPSANMETILTNEVVPIPNTHGPDIKHFDGSNKV